MKIIVAMCLVAIAACQTYSLPNHHLNGKLMSMTRTKVPRIINGEDADIRNYPWQASLRIIATHICGAVVVSRRTAITAAHCINPKLKHLYTLQVGSSTLLGKGNVFVVARIIVYPGHKMNIHARDIAVLKFDRDITGASQTLAKPVSLPKDDSDFSGESCDITGWGMIKTGTTSNGKAVLLPTDHLQRAPTVVISEKKCLEYGFQIRKEHVCVYTGHNGACYGDSGGALTCKNVLVGITSFGRKGCSVTYPSIYTRISEYRDWIRKYIE